ncbi:DUF3887 domain-containing protein [Sporomusa malonica]|uniref:DUF3887 domain-containing protein n=1 Tax=Sporomusa malonica TaxID=112901 RepID=A0A1W2C6A3_9FIRM|nr:DUF3887 domain-containing protein [Sporomusa malonica]SMC80636.1 Protein of unknown function [Sporomusa malonica]
MKLCKIVVLITFLISLIVLSGCSAQQLSAEETKKFADPITENMLLAMNEDNYSRFSQDFDEQMKNVLNETQYKNTFTAIKAKIGKYISKEVVSVETKDGYAIVMYKAKFSQEPADVIVRSVFSDNNGKKHISGFWLDSPKLRDN